MQQLSLFYRFVSAMTGNQEWATTSLGTRLFIIMRVWSGLLLIPEMPEFQKLPLHPLQPQNL